MDIKIKVTIKLDKKDKEISLTQDEAKELFYKLKEIYEPYYNIPYTPSYPIITYDTSAYPDSVTTKTKFTC